MSGFENLVSLKLFVFISSTNWDWSETVLRITSPERYRLEIGKKESEKVYDGDYER